MKRKLRKFWDKQRGTVVLVMLGLVIFVMTVVSTMGIAGDNESEQLAWLPTGYHGLGWKNFGYLNPIPEGSQAGYGNILTSSRGGSGGFGALGFVGTGGGIAGIVGLSGGFGGGGSGDGGEEGEPGPVQLVLLNQDLGGDFVTGSGTQEGEGGEKFELGSKEEDQEFDSETHAIPEPATMFLFGSGAIGAALKRRKK